MVNPIQITLPVTELPKLIKTHPDEPYFIRRFNANRSEDSQRLTDMDEQPLAVKYLQAKQSPIEIDGWLRGNEATIPDNRWLLYAVCDNSGEAIGWIQLYESDYEEEIKKQAIIPVGALILEISYGKLISADPHLHFSGVTVSGVRQVIDLLKKREQIFSTATQTNPRPLVVIAFTIPENIPSHKVLQKNNFSLLPKKVIYDNQPNMAWIKYCV